MWSLQMKEIDIEKSKSDHDFTQKRTDKVKSAFCPCELCFKCTLTQVH